MADFTPIQPLFVLKQNPELMGKTLIQFTSDDYNKELGSALIDAKNDAEAISSFLSEYKDSPETLKSYTKEIERLLLWCIHLAKVNIGSPGINVPYSGYRQPLLAKECAVSIAV